MPKLSNAINFVRHQPRWRLVVAVLVVVLLGGWWWKSGGRSAIPKSAWTIPFRSH